MRKKSRLVKWIKIILIIYLMAGFLLYFFQDKFLFHPEALKADYAFQFATPFKEINIAYDSFTTFNIIRFKPADSSLKKGAVIYCHGNMENINHYAEFAPDFTRHGYEVWIMDYPGFGKSTGPINEDILYTEALQVYKMVMASGYAADSIIIYGKSLGTGIAAQLASVSDCKRLILECPYYSIENIAAHYAWMYPVGWMIHYKIPTFEYIKKITAPIVIFHGTEDGTIPFSNAEKLKVFMKPGDELIAIEGGGHNDLNDFPVMKQKLDSLLELK
ncbi:MAG TPA: alpha/beta fold hydrolase [Panacibacter sp.]|nr:alpha/beta fold hydrolase [Panacibacter sp.]